MRRLAPLTLAAGLAAATLTGAPLAAEEFTAEEIKDLALQAILENPQIVMEAVAILQERDAAEAEAQAEALISGNRDLLERDPNAPVIGNPDGDVTVVEFFDYNCPYCKRAADEVATLIDGDDGVRVLYREWPVLGEGSVFAARAALAAREQDRYAEMHEALMGARGRVDEQAVIQVATDLGLDVEKLRADMGSAAVESHIQTSMQLAQSLGFTGTPSFVIGESRAPGLIDAESMQGLVDEARNGG